MSQVRENECRSKLTADLSPRWICIKAAMFVVLMMLSGALLLSERFSPRNVILLAICVWAACRAYYFAFYVIEKYIDPQFRFSGLLDAARHLFRQRQ